MILLSRRSSFPWPLTASSFDKRIDAHASSFKLDPRPHDHRLNGTRPGQFARSYVQIFKTRTASIYSGLRCTLRRRRSTLFAFLAAKPCATFFSSLLFSSLSVPFPSFSHRTIIIIILSLYELPRRFGAQRSEDRRLLMKMLPLPIGWFLTMQPARRQLILALSPLLKPSVNKSLWQLIVKKKS